MIESMRAFERAFEAHGMTLDSQPVGMGRELDGQDDDPSSPRAERAGDLRNVDAVEAHAWAFRQARSSTRSLACSRSSTATSRATTRDSRRRSSQPSTTAATAA